jgi:hypothetical protein
MSENYAATATLEKKFTSRAGNPPVPVTLSGSPVIAVYKGNDSAAVRTSAESYIGLSVDFDGETGSNHVTIDFLSSPFFEGGKDYQVVILTGTVSGASVAGEVVFEFRINHPYIAGATINRKFTSRAGNPPVPFILAGGPVISVYKDDAIGTEKTSAESYIGLAVDFDSKTGLNHVFLDLAGSAFFEAGADYQVVMTTGTVSGNSVVGETLFNFTVAAEVVAGVASNDFAEAWRDIGGPNELEYFGQSVIYNPSVGAPVSIVAIFEEDEVEEEFGSKGTTAARRGRLGFLRDATEGVVDPTIDDTVTIEGDLWAVGNIIGLSDNWCDLELVIDDRQEVSGPNYRSRD